MAERADDPENKYQKEHDRVKSSDMSRSNTQAVLRFLFAFDKTTALLKPSISDIS
jgi:hypothetical protein